MERKIAFTDETKEQIIVEQGALGFRLKEDQRHLDGNRLIFTNEPYTEFEPNLPKPRRDLAAEIDDHEKRIKKLEKK